MPWDERQDAGGAKPGGLETFEQLWFAGCHADIGGGYPENESRLSDIALEWMVADATHEALGDARLIVDRSVLQTKGRINGMQHDETRSLAFRWAKKTLREPLAGALLHPPVLQRFDLDGVQQFDRTARYRPEALRQYPELAKYYTGFALQRTTCWQRVSAWTMTAEGRWAEAFERRVGPWVARIYPNDWEKIMTTPDARKPLTADSILSCLGLLFLKISGVLALWILLVEQVLGWLKSGVWTHYPIDAFVSSPFSGWNGLEAIVSWLFRLPVTPALAMIGIFLFWAFGVASAKLYKLASLKSEQTTTPAQTRA